MGTGEKSSDHPSDATSQTRTSMPSTVSIVRTHGRGSAPAKSQSGPSHLSSQSGSCSAWPSRYSATPPGPAEKGPESSSPL